MEDDSRGDTSNGRSLSEKAPKAPRTQKKKSTNNNAKKKSGAGSSFLDSFRNEWEMFWAGLMGESEDLDAKVENLSGSQIKELTKALSEQKMRLNQKLESIQKEIELNSSQLQASPNSAQRIHELSDLGQEVSLELHKIDEKLRNVRGQDLD